MKMRPFVAILLALLPIVAIASNIPFDQNPWANFTTTDGWNFSYCTGDFAWTSSSYLSFTSNYGGTITITMNEGATTFTLNSIDLKGPSWSYTVTVTGYSGDTFVRSQDITFNSTSWGTYSVSGFSGINKVVITNPGNSTDVSVDNVNFTVPNMAPTDISLSNSSVSDGSASGTTVGTLSSTDAHDSGDHTYTLASGGTDNTSFTISGTSLLTAFVADYATKSSYAIKIRSTDTGGLYYEENFTITVNAPVGPTPTYLLVSDMTTPAAANGIYEKQSGTYGSLGYEYWKHQSAGYYLYADEFEGTDYWNLDNDLDDADVYIFATMSGGPYGSPHLVPLDSWTNLSGARGAEFAITEYTPSASITFTNGANGALNFVQSNATPPENDWLCGQFSLAGDATGATLNSVTVTLAGTYDSGDLASTPFQLYVSNTNDFSTSSALGSSVADPSSGGDVTFSGLSDAIPASTRYYWVTADISASATGDDTMSGTIDAAGDLTITSGTLSGSSSYGKLNAGTDASLPVGLVSFSARCEGRSVILEWLTESETDNRGFILERCEEKAWSQIASYETHAELKGRGNTSSRTQYQFIDSEVEAGRTYSYRLSDVSMDGEVNVYASLSITPDVLPSFTEMERAYPNPFNPDTHIAYHLAKDGVVNIVVFDLLGRKVKTLFDDPQLAGSYQVYWDATDEGGDKVPSGTYLIRMQSGNIQKTQKVMLVK